MALPRLERLGRPALPRRRGGIHRARHLPPGRNGVRQSAGTRRPARRADASRGGRLAWLGVRRPGERHPARLNGRRLALRDGGPGISAAGQLGARAIRNRDPHPAPGALDRPRPNELSRRRVPASRVPGGCHIRHRAALRRRLAPRHGGGSLSVWGADGPRGRELDGAAAADQPLGAPHPRHRGLLFRGNWLVVGRGLGREHASGERDGYRERHGHARRHRPCHVARRRRAAREGPPSPRDSAGDSHRRQSAERIRGSLRHRSPGGILPGREAARKELLLDGRDPAGSRGHRRAPGRPPRGRRGDPRHSRAPRVASGRARACRPVRGSGRVGLGYRGALRSHERRGLGALPVHARGGWELHRELFRQRSRRAPRRHEPLSLGDGQGLGPVERREPLQDGGDPGQAAL